MTGKDGETTSKQKQSGGECLCLRWQRLSVVMTHSRSGGEAGVICLLVSIAFSERIWVPSALPRK